MYCPDCGTEAEAGDRFCTACGARLPSEPAPAGAPPAVVARQPASPAAAMESSDRAADLPAGGLLLALAALAAVVLTFVESLYSAIRWGATFSELIHRSNLSFALTSLSIALVVWMVASVVARDISIRVFDSRRFRGLLYAATAAGAAVLVASRAIRIGGPIWWQFLLDADALITAGASAAVIVVGYEAWRRAQATPAPAVKQERGS